MAGFVKKVSQWFVYFTMLIFEEVEKIAKKIETLTTQQNMPLKQIKRNTHTLLVKMQIRPTSLQKLSHSSL